MKCKLCDEEKVLRNSHIIPEFFYTPIYDEKHKLHMLSTDPKKKNKWEQKGLREYLLCDDCEQLFHETYIRELFYGSQKVWTTDHWKTEDLNGKSFIRIDNVDYKKFKIFQLSVLWRASIASGDFFKTVSVGTKHENILKQKLLSQNPGEPDDYGCYLFCITSEGGYAVGFIASVDSFRIQGHRCYRFVFGGFAWLYVVSGHKKFAPNDACIITEDKPIMAIIKEQKEIEYLQNVAPDLIHGQKPF
jgi:hypothetical protein